MQVDNYISINLIKQNETAEQREARLTKNVKQLELLEREHLKNKMRKKVHAAHVKLKKELQIQ